MQSKMLVLAVVLAVSGATPETVAARFVLLFNTGKRLGMRDLPKSHRASRKSSSALPISIFRFTPRL